MAGGNFRPELMPVKRPYILQTRVLADNELIPISGNCPGYLHSIELQGKAHLGLIEQYRNQSGIDLELLYVNPLDKKVLCTNILSIHAVLKDL